MGNAGRLDRVVLFQRPETADDGFRTETVFVQHGGPVAARKTDVSDAERVRSGEVSATITTRFIVRYSPFTRQITPKYRLTCEGLDYDITGIKEAGGRRAWLEITAAARSDK